MDCLNQRMNDLIRRAAGRLPASAATGISGPAAIGQPRHGSVDGGAGRGQAARVSAAAIINRAIRQAAGKE
jgi:hypothetical protein